MQKRTPTTKEEAMQYAIDWQNWASEQDLSLDEFAEWHIEFTDIGKKYGLLKEFVENGII